MLFNILFPSIAYDFFFDVGARIKIHCETKQPGAKTHKTFPFFLSKLSGLFEKFFISLFTPSSALLHWAGNWKSHLKIFQTRNFSLSFMNSKLPVGSEKLFSAMNSIKLKAAREVIFLSDASWRINEKIKRNHEIWHNKLRRIYIESRRISEATKI